MDSKSYAAYRCYKCMELGHCSADCKAPKSKVNSVQASRKKQSLCTRCKQTGHYAGECKAEKCTVCYQMGHNRKTCVPDTCYCYKCTRIGHYPMSCPDDPKLMDVTCFKCKHKGHYATYCTVMICSNCGGKDHLSKVCPEQRLCYKCHMPGHFSGQCETNAVTDISDEEEVFDEPKPKNPRKRRRLHTLDIEDGSQSPAISIKPPPPPSSQDTIVMSSGDDDLWLGKNLLTIDQGSSDGDIKKKKRDFSKVLSKFQSSRKKGPHVLIPGLDQ